MSCLLLITAEIEREFYFTMTRHPLNFQILAQCKITKARCSLMTLPHHVVETPVFMPVGTQVSFELVKLKTLLNTQYLFPRVRLKG